MRMKYLIIDMTISRIYLLDTAAKAYRFLLVLFNIVDYYSGQSFLGTKQLLRTTL